MKNVEAFLRENHITRYWTRPKSPKEKPFVEGIIGAFPRECLDYHYQPIHVKETLGDCGFLAGQISLLPTV
jgi:hypothetical protein